MSAFSALLLAWPFYLAVNGRLAAYINLAKPAGGNGSAAVSAAGATAGAVSIAQLLPEFL
jgi:hypothetical protein